MLIDIAVPWSNEVVYSQNVTGVGKGDQACMKGQLGQTTILKIFINGTEVKRSNSSVDPAGDLISSVATYIFLPAIQRTEYRDKLIK